MLRVCVWGLYYSGMGNARGKGAVRGGEDVEGKYGTSRSASGVLPLLVVWFIVGLVVGSVVFQVVVGRPLYDVRMSELWLLAILLVGIAVHELLHGVGWVVMGTPRGEVEFGVAWKALSLSAHCGAVMRVGAYRFAVLLPGVVLGVVPFVVGVLVGSEPVAFLGLFWLLGSVGDVYVVWIIRRVPGGAFVRDCPVRLGVDVVSC